MTTTNTEIPIDLEGVLDHSIHAAKIAGDILQENFGNLSPDQIQKKDAFDFVTEIDESAEKAIIDFLKDQYPHHNIHAEESGKTESDSEFHWVIDPLDGTKNYIHGIPIYAVSIGLRFRNQVVAATVYYPPHDELFTAIKGKGASLNQKPIQVSQTSESSSAMIATGFPHNRKEFLDLYLECFKSLFLQVSAIRRPGACAIDLAYLACGKFDGFYEFKLNPWDLGAGVLLIEEAGGRVSDPFGGNNYFFTGDLVAGNPAIHEKIIQTISPICQGRLGW